MILHHCIGQEAGMRRRVADALWLFWRALYPLLFYGLIGMGMIVGMEAAGFCPDGEDAVLTTAMAAVVASVPLGIWYRRDRRRVARIRHWDVRMGIFTTLAGIGAAFFFNNLILLTGLTSEAYEEAGALLYQPPLGIQIVAVGILIPIAEELIFRGLGYYRLRWHLSFFEAAVISAMLFGWYHGNIVQGLYAGALGLLMAWAYEISQSLYAPVCLHIAANLSSVLFTELVPETVQLRLPLIPVMLVFGAVMIVGIYHMREDVRQREVTVNRNSLL